eukprot:XP_011432106.1 PREDICTED: uncharacterized protein LOC105331553 [Crassostrea gigas]
MDRCVLVYAILAVLLGFWPHVIESKKCTKKTMYYAAQHYCASRTLWWCDSSGYRRISVYEISTVCCPGYIGSNCETPICNPPCANGGTCVAPNQCSCPSIVGGNNCQEPVTCSHLQPCFPGTCNGSSCICDEGFSGASCLQMESPQTATLSRFNATLKNVKRSDNRQLYQYNADAFSSFELLWVGRKSYNYFLIDFEAVYNPNIPYPPSYINGSAFGILSTHSRVILSKIGRGGSGTTDVSLNTTLPCPVSYNDTSPSTEVYRCHISYDQFDRTLEDGDNLTIEAVVETGGYRDLWHNGQFYTRESFNRSITNTHINFMFDFTKPKHCSYTNNCSTTNDVPLKIPLDASKDPFTFGVDDWSDIPSGIEKYFLEFHRMRKRLHTQTLTEEAPMNPFYREARNESSLPFPEFTPPDSGIYSVILQVTDKANNSEFARQIVIYDPNSTITTTGENNFHVSSAEKESNYNWQSRCSTVRVTWENYFENSFHIDNHFLLPVEDFPTQFRGGNVEELKDEIVKKVKTFYDDHDGKRTISAVKHVNGITEFEYYYTYISYSKSTGNETQNETSTNGIMISTETPYTTMVSTEIATNIDNFTESLNNTETDNNSSTVAMTSVTVATTGAVTTGSPCLPTPNTGNTENQWIKIQNISGGTHTIVHQWEDGDSINISVRARDIVNNTKVASRLVSFDSSPPYSSEAVFSKNTGNRTFEFSSSVRTRASDKHSGVRQLQWRLITNGEIHEEGYFINDPIKAADCIDSEKCYCIPMGDCFNIDMEFDFNNCWLAIDKPLLSNASLILELEAFNQAMLSSNVTRYKLNHLTSFDGIDDSSGITNLKSEDLGIGIKLTWDTVPSCYRVSYISIFLYTDCDKSKPPKEISLPTDRNELEITNLESGKEFCIEVISNSSGIASPIVSKLTFKTAANIPIAMIAAISAVIAILLGIIVIFVILWRNGHVKPETKRRLTMYLKRPVTLMQGLRRQTGFYSGRFQDEDIYDFGKMVFSENEGWLCGFDDIDLKGKLKSGGFADIYLAKICKKDMAVAKILKEDHTEEDRLVLQAKISFFATEVPPHDNIIQFLGSVLNHPLFGPYMLLEYCELGPMRDWLIEHRNKVNDELITEFCKLVQGIAKGMECLAIKGIVHKRLATRNVLLTSRLVPKIAGFGPTPEEGKNEVDKKGGTNRKPMKWLAPECYEFMQNCTTMSDVWAFGVVIWETFSTGQNPYPGMDAKIVPMKVKSGYRMNVPEFCPETHGSIMEKCWATKPKDRPTFTNIVTLLDSYYDARYPCDYEIADTV